MGKNLKVKRNIVWVWEYTHRITPNLKIGVPLSLAANRTLQCISYILYTFLWVQGDFNYG